MSEQNLFADFVKEIAIDYTDYLVEGNLNDLPEYMKKMIENASSIMKENTIDEIKVLGGSIKKNEEKFNEFVKKAEKLSENEKFKDIKKDIKDYIKNLKELVEKYYVTIIPVKELPWENVIFKTVPRITYDKKIHLLDNSIAYCGEIKCVVSKTTIYSKMKDGKPLFAPYIGELDLGGFILDSSQKEPLSQNYSYINAIIKSLDSNSVRSQVGKYDVGYQRHGEPICDFLMKDENLMEVMNKLTSGLESKRISTEFSPSAIALPHASNGTTLMIAIDESGGSGSERFLNCFEAFLKFSAACCEAPSTSKGGAEAPGAPSPEGGVRTPGGQQLSTWTQEDLAKEAQKRGSAGVPPGMAVWSEEDLTKAAAERGTGLPPGMEVWTEQELEELAKKRQGGALDIPEWKPEAGMVECANCGYALRKSWDECPICQTPVGGDTPSKPDTEAKSEPSPSDASEDVKETDENPDSANTEE
ncbi:MAG: hypothetical protein ACFFBP_16165 [Promethearchaeota archaeon]